MQLSDFREDEIKQRQGTPIYIGSATFYVRRWGTPEAIDKRKELMHALFGPLHKRTEMDDAELLAHWLADYGVVGWEGVKDENGELVEYSQDTARSVFLDEGMYLSLNEHLFIEASKFENYLFDQAVESAEEIKKH